MAAAEELVYSGYNAVFLNFMSVGEIQNFSDHYYEPDEPDYDVYAAIEFFSENGIVDIFSLCKAILEHGEFLVGTHAHAIVIGGEDRDENNHAVYEVTDDQNQMAHTFFGVVLWPPWHIRDFALGR